jgi:uncharacterized protein (TIGR00299 family) protein
MKHLLFDPYCGASGDMILGCLLDLGADAEAVGEAVESVGCKVEIDKVRKNHISATRARVISDRRCCSLEEARSILQGSRIKDKALERAQGALRALAMAEATVHGLDPEKARLHEVGALDALADIAGSCKALESLGVERVLSLPVSVGGGSVSSAHGLLPVPAPATLEMLRAHKMRWRGGPVDQELLTPTGAALLAVAVEEFLDEYPVMRAERIGYGAGSRDLPLPNALRALIGEVRQEHLQDQVVQIEANVDDVTGEILGNLMESMMDAGALDVSLIPAMMKKGRSGSIIRAIARQEDLERLAGLIMWETGSLGVRVFPSVHRYLASREARAVEVQIKGSAYRALVKVSRLGGKVLNLKPEFEDCKGIAAKTGLPLREVMKRVEEEGRRELGA